MNNAAHYASQAGFELRFDWGAQALAHLRQPGDVVVIVDVLSFTTCVDIACARGATIVPWPEKGASAQQAAARHRAALAATRGQQGPSLSPASLVDIAAGTRLLLPSPNGSALSTLAGESGEGLVFAASLRNLSAVAAQVASLARPVLVVAAGERWPDGSLRPALEDLVCAGAVIDALAGTASPEARAAAATYHGLRSTMDEALRACASSIELHARGHADDVTLALQLDASRCVPQLQEGAYVDVSVTGAR